MKVYVELVRSDLAEVIETPPLWRRIFLREQERHAFAVRVLVVTGGYRWVYDHTGKPVDPETQRAIDKAVRASRRPRDLVAVTGPPE